MLLTIDTCTVYQRGIDENAKKRVFTEEEDVCVLCYNTQKMQFGEIRETTWNSEMSCGGIMTWVTCTLQLECEFVGFYIDFKGERRKRRVFDETKPCYGIR
uniref:Uncharacterized protein n=1 Tax=Attheya septentrionalis TaxID=420275 RepID=A0A7S2UMI2_9STRA|mmetsp:Transcript_483/g.812  ORF Transcript_483/g.812 Transcript_483/m.812 type:complete len:101 (+) Transcript_483:78-380(+)